MSKHAPGRGWWRRAAVRWFVGLGRTLALVSVLCAARPALAWEPSRPVELIVPAGSGGGADQMAHVLRRSSAAHRLLGQPVVVTNKSGGDGAEGFLHMKASAHNPHKVLMAMSNLFTTPRASGLAFSYRDLTPLAMLALDEFVLWVHPGVPFSTARDYFDAIRAAPDRTFSIGGTGLKQEDQLLAVALQKRLGKKLSYVPYRGGGEVAARLAEGRVTCSVNNPLEAVERWQSGQLRPLCVFRAERMPQTKRLSGGHAWSDIPTCRSAGVDLEYRMLRGAFLPSGVSPEVVAFYVEWLRRVHELPEWREFLDAAGLEDRFATGREFEEWLAQADGLHQTWMRDAGLLPGQSRSP